MQKQQGRVRRMRDAEWLGLQDGQDSVPGVLGLASLNATPRSKETKKAVQLWLIITRIHITFLHGAGEMTFYPTLHQ